MAGDVPKTLVLRLKAQGNIKVFVETGTHKGLTTAWAAENFEKILTIELDYELHHAAVAKFADCPNVTCMLADSRDGLAFEVPMLVHPAIFWLDAHYSGGVTAGAGDECPLLGELEVIIASEYLHYILIDDAHMFTGTPPTPHDPACWPKYEAIQAILKRRGYFVKLVGNAIVAVPGDAANEVY